MSEAEQLLIKSLAFAQSCMIQALAATHPNPDNLRTAFIHRGDHLLDSLPDTQFRRGVQMHLDKLEKHIPGGTNGRP